MHCIACQLLTQESGSLPLDMPSCFGCMTLPKITMHMIVATMREEPLQPWREWEMHL